jgi:catechol-2,3-dioxygenase
MIRRDEDDRFVFFKVAEGYGGHTQNLAIFETSNTLNPQESTLHHIALNIALEDYESEKMRLEGLGLKVNATEHEWLHVRSLYFYDPEGNHLEFVAYDESVR